MNIVMADISNSIVVDNCRICPTLKNSSVDPPLCTPYWILVCAARSSADLMGEIMLWVVRKAAKLAVYDEITMRVKNHHTPPMIRPDIDLPDIVFL